MHCVKATPANKWLLYEKCNIKESDTARPGESPDQHRRALWSAFPGSCIRKAYFLQHDQRVAFSWGNLRQNQARLVQGGRGEQENWPVEGKGGGREEWRGQVH